MLFCREFQDFHEYLSVRFAHFIWVPENEIKTSSWTLSLGMHWHFFSWSFMFNEKRIQFTLSLCFFNPLFGCLFRSDFFQSSIYRCCFQSLDHFLILSTPSSAAVSSSSTGALFNCFLLFKLDLFQPACHPLSLSDWENSLLTFLVIFTKPGGDSHPHSSSILVPVRRSCPWMLWVLLHDFVSRTW